MVDRSAVKAALQQLESQHADNLTAQALMEVQGLEQFVMGESEARMMRTHQGLAWLITCKTRWMASMG